MRIDVNVWRLLNIWTPNGSLGWNTGYPMRIVEKDTEHRPGPKSSCCSQSAHWLRVIQLTLNHTAIKILTGTLIFPTILNWKMWSKASYSKLRISNNGKREVVSAQLNVWLCLFPLKLNYNHHRKPLKCLLMCSTIWGGTCAKVFKKKYKEAVFSRSSDFTQTSHY